jgi:hypothetical protein
VSKRPLTLAALVLAALVLAGAGVASAYALRTIFLTPGHCKKVHGTKVCARRVRPVTSTRTQTSTVTTTVAPSPIGQNLSGNGDSTLAPMTIPANGVVVHWTAQPDQYGYNVFSVSSSPDDANFIEFDNGSGATSGTSFIPAGTYTFEVSASAAWTLSF